MTPTREQIVIALFAKLVQLGPNGTPPATTFATVQRGLVLPTDSPFIRLTQPILCLFKPPGVGETLQQPGIGLPTKHIFEYWAVGYCRNVNGTAWDIVVNPLLDAIEDALAPDNLSNGKLTLGGLVYDCRPEGEIIINNGDTEPANQGSFIFPIKIIIP